MGCCVEIYIGEDLFRVGDYMRNNINIFFACFAVIVLIVTFLGEFLMTNMWGVMFGVALIITVIINVIILLVFKLETLESKIDKISKKLDNER